ncbi:MAG: hypothetical protein Q7U04_13455 [Bacteriovorax sp.]|nr:hypothetical protein [Bacteriovorax sp.]
MIESLQLYLNAFKGESPERGERKLSYLELMGISWSLHMLYSFYSIFALYLGVKSYSYFSNSKNFAHFALESFSFKLQKITLLSTLFGVIFYPFIFQFAYKFWKGCFKFYANIFDYQDELLEEKADEILKSSFTSNLFLILPIIGNTLSNLALAFFLFKGLKKKFDFTSLQAVLVLITPLFMLFLFTVFSASYFLFLFTLL